MRDFHTTTLNHFHPRISGNLCRSLIDNAQLYAPHRWSKVVNVNLNSLLHYVQNLVGRFENVNNVDPALNAVRQIM